MATRERLPAEVPSRWDAAGDSAGICGLRLLGTERVRRSVQSRSCSPAWPPRAGSPPSTRRTCGECSSSGPSSGLPLGIETVILHLSDRPARRRPRLLRRRRPPQRRAAAVRPAGDDQRGRVLPLSAAARDRLPAARAAAVRGGGAIWMAFLVACFVLTIVRLGPRRRATWLVDGDARAADRLEPRHRPGPGRRHAADGARCAVGDRRSAANIKVFPALVAIWWIGRRDVRSLAWFAAWMAALVAVPVRRSSRPRRSTSSGRSGSARSATSRTARSTSCRRCSGRSRSSPASSSRGGSRRRAGAGPRRSRCRCSRRRAC